jgi:prepilin-type N-terminal cleavage/methylation domain-containing protein
MKLLLIRQIKKADPGERPNHPEGGFTLIEILVALVIMAIIMVMIIYPFLSSTGYLAKARARAEAQQVAQDVLATMTREISQAMDIQLDPKDTSICAVLLPKKDAAGNYIYPLTPETDSSGAIIQAVRFWQVQRDDKGSILAFSDGIQNHDNGSPTTNSWYTQFQSNPKNLSPTQTSSSFIARSIISNALTYTGDTPSVLRGISRKVPFPDDIIFPSTRQYEDYIIAITPHEANFDIPVLSFTPTPQVNETLQRDNSGVYVFKAKYPLWESNWSIAIYNSAGGAVTSFTAATAATALPGVEVDPYNGKVSFIQKISITPTIDSSPWTLPNIPVAPDSETVIVNGEFYSRVDDAITPVGNQYKIDYATGTLTFDAALALPATATITYQQALIAATNVVMASYSTRALLNIDIVASKRDTQSGLPQSIHLQQKVKLKNVVR